MSPLRPRTAALLAIGDEVLRGEVTNSNAAFLGDALFDLGFVVREHRVISDEVADIQATLRRLGDEVDVIISTGGLGPTDDDRTVDVVAGLIDGGEPPITHEPSRLAMERAFAARAFAMTPNNLRQVRVPRGATALPNAVGIAPGFSVRIGQAEAFFLPGIPREMQRIFHDHIVARLGQLQAASGVPRALVRTFHIYGMGESHIDHRLAGLIEGLPDVSLHYRTAAPENHVKLIVRGTDPAWNQTTLARLEAEVHKRLGHVVYGVDEDNFPLAVARALRNAKATLAVAESCTGGYAGQLLTSEAGASEVFLGGVIAYHNAVKQAVLGVRADTLAAHGAVSEPCAIEMAEGARRVCGATLAVAITGIAGASKETSPVPEPESPGGKPVGTVAFAVAGPKGTRAETRQFFSGRERIRRAAAYFALDLARRYFEGDLQPGSQLELNETHPKS
ncbi:MAG TPA: CinA family nicotinamide mononucleotide deamidase-related protein [Polyangia bacterium]